MTRAQRRAHLLVWIVVGAGTLAVFVAALVARPDHVGPAARAEETRP